MTKEQIKHLPAYNCRGTIDCDKAKKDGELCLGYGGDEDEPCEQCKNCIKCECGYYQLGETDKDEHLADLKKDNEGYEKDNTLLVNQFNQTSAKLTNAIEILKKYHKECPSKYSFEDIDDMAEQFLNSEVENGKTTLNHF